LVSSHPDFGGKLESQWFVVRGPLLGSSSNSAKHTNYTKKKIKKYQKPSWFFVLFVV